MNDAIKILISGTENGITEKSLGTSLYNEVRATNLPSNYLHYAVVKIVARNISDFTGRIPITECEKAMSRCCNVYNLLKDEAWSTAEQMRLDIARDYQIKSSSAEHSFIAELFTATSKTDKREEKHIEQLIQHGYGNGNHCYHN